MGADKVGEKYRCNIGRNEEQVINVGGSTLVCCGQDIGEVSQRDRLFVDHMFLASKMVY